MNRWWKRNKGRNHGDDEAPDRDVLHFAANTPATGVRLKWEAIAAVSEIERTLHQQITAAAICKTVADGRDVVTRDDVMAVARCVLDRMNLERQGATEP